MFNGRIDSDKNALVKTVVIGVYGGGRGKSMDFYGFFQAKLNPYFSNTSKLLAALMGSPEARNLLFRQA